MRVDIFTREDRDRGAESEAQVGWLLEIVGWTDYQGDVAQLAVLGLGLSWGTRR